MQPNSQVQIYAEHYSGYPVIHPSVPNDIPALYHYSKPGGLVGLLKSKSLWLSHIQYQNDGQEFEHALQLLNTILKDEYELSNTLGSAARYMPSVGGGIQPVYTYSLTTEKDLLSQWRGYCPTGGYSYSIEMQQIKAMMLRENLILAKCIYVEDEKRDFIKRYIIGTSPEEYKNDRDNGIVKFNSLVVPKEGVMDIHYRQNMHSFANRILNYAPVLKHEEFREESEWRLITYNDYQPLMYGMQNTAPSRNDTISFREGINTLVPYVEMSLLSEGYDNVNFSEIVVSPNPNPELAKSACKLMVSGQKCTVNNSSIPYRTW